MMDLLGVTAGNVRILISFEALAVCLRPGWFLDLLLSAGLFFYSFALASSFSGFRMGGQTNTKHDMGG